MKNTIKVQRAMHDFSQQQLADQIGVSRLTIHSIEKGKMAPSTVIALKLAKLFKVKVEELFALEVGD